MEVEKARWGLDRRLVKIRCSLEGVKLASQRCSNLDAKNNGQAS